MVRWQNTPSSPTTTASYLYDGEGQRVAQQVTNTSTGTTTTTSYLGTLVEVTSDGTTTTTTDYLYAAGKLLAEAINGTLTYLVTNHQGSVSEALDTNGNVTASQLYTPYGGARYQSGTMPTSYGYIGQRADAATSGLDYYGARYYDPTVGQFTSADTLVAGGLNRYGYVGGNPETLTDPSGHIKVEKDDFLVGAGLALGAGLILTAPVAQAPSVTGGLSGGVWIATDDSHGQATGYEFLNEMDIPYGWDGTPTWNQRTAPRSGPRSNPNLTPVHETQHTGGGASGGPQTQTGGAGAGAPPGGGKPPVASPVPGDDDGCGCGDTVPVYRVQGGGSMERIIVDASGNIRIEGEGMLHLSFANSAHAEYFLGLRGAGAYIVTFQIQATFLDFLRSVAVPQRLASRYPDSPQIDDPRQWTDVYGLRSNLFNELQEFTVSGSGRIIRPGDNC